MEGSMIIQGMERKQSMVFWLHSDAHSSTVSILNAHTERRNRLTARVKAENPSYTDLEIEARLEQFGA
jgi:hypothetical protein